MNETKKGVLIVVSGPSGVGKSTLIDRFLEEDAQSEFSVSYTTRQMRPHEEDGIDYYFTDENIFKELIEKGYFMEWENVHGNYYGTPRAEIMAALEKGKDIILDIDVKGALSIKGQCPASRLIFIEPPSVDGIEMPFIPSGRKRHREENAACRTRNCTQRTIRVYYHER